MVDLYAIRFDPVLRERDDPNWIDADAPEDIVASWRVRERMLERAGPLKRFAIRRLLGDRDSRGIIRLVQERFRPKDVLEQQRKVATADALAFISPVYFVGFPAIMKGRIERVFTLGFAFGLTPAAWRGDVAGRVPLLKHRKALIIQTIFDERAYQAGLKDPMNVLIDEWAFPPGADTWRERTRWVESSDPASRARWSLGRSRSSRAAVSGAALMQA